MMNHFHNPAPREFSFLSRLTVVVVLLIASLSIAGLLFPTTVYPSEDLRRSFLPNDVVTLILAVPVLVGSMILAQRRSLFGMLFWPGALFYIVYSLIPYAVATPHPILFVLYLVSMALSLFVLYGLLIRIPAAEYQTRLRSQAPERLAGGVLVGLGILFLFRQVTLGIQALQHQVILTRPEAATIVADLFFMPIWVIGGVLLWRRQAFGYVLGVGLFFQACMLFIGLLTVFVFQPILAAAPFPTQDFIVILTMSLICFIPLALLIRNAASKKM
jgi:hypothetical protein